MSMRIGQGYDVHAFSGVESSSSSGDSSHIVIDMSRFLTRSLCSRIPMEMF